MVYEVILAQIPFFAHLGDDALEELSRRLHLRHFQRDQIIFHKNDPGSTLYIIMAGKVKIVLPSAEGENVIVALLSSGDFFGELSLFDGEMRSATAVAAETTDILTLSHEDFSRYITDNPRTATAVLAELSRRLRRTDELLSDAAFCNLPARIAKRLLELSDRHGQESPEGGIQINFKLKQQDLADMVGATRESVNKILKTYKGKNILRISKGIITISDPEALRRFAH